MDSDQDLDGIWRDATARRLREAIQALFSSDGEDRPASKVILVENRIKQLTEVDPGNPLAEEGRAAAEAYKLRHPEEFGPLPPLRTIGETSDLCPSCGIALARRPGRKTTCKACGRTIFVRTRPLDGESVLVNESGAAAIEEDWHVQYKASQRKPRPMDDVWQRRIEEAQKAGPDADPEVERLAQRLFAELCAACLTEAPRDAKDRLLAGIDDPALRERVDRRIWQLQVQSI